MSNNNVANEEFAAKYEACQSWVNQFDAVPVSVVEKLREYSGCCDIEEITPGPEGSEDYGSLPVWSTMWSFSNRSDKEWALSEVGLNALADCGFRVYQSEDYDVLIGIDGGGYDFYINHWIPLYDARGLRWHVE